VKDIKSLNAQSTRVDHSRTFQFALIQITQQAVFTKTTVVRTAKRVRPISNPPR
jgi:hypothetical protein